MRKLTIVSGAALFLISLTMGCQTKPSAEELFTQAKKYQENQDFAKAVDVYQQIIKFYPYGEQTDEAQFMIGFIYANHLEDTVKAHEAYTRFLEKYSTQTDSGMIASAKWELANLGRNINDIQMLKSFAAGSNTTSDTLGAKTTEQ